MSSKINLIIEDNQTPQAVKELLTEFFDETHAESIPHNLFLGAKDWIQIAGISLPIIMYVENSVVRKKCNGLELDQEDMETWLQK